MNRRARTALVLATATQRLLELRISARNRAQLGRAEQASASTYPAMVGVHVALFAVSAWPRRARRVSRPVEIAALAGLAASTALRLWVIRTLGAELERDGARAGGRSDRDQRSVSIRAPPELRRRRPRVRRASRSRWVPSQRPWCSRLRMRRCWSRGFVLRSVCWTRSQGIARPSAVFPVSFRDPDAAAVRSRQARASRAA